MANDSVDAGGAAEHAGTGDPVRFHREKEMGGELGFHGPLRLCSRSHLLGPALLPYGFW